MIRSDREGPAQPGSSNGAPTPKHGAARRLLAIATVGGAVALIVLALLSARADAAPSGCVTVEPIEGLPELAVQVEDECPPPDPAPVCARGFAWGGQCWTRREGQAFTGWLRDHGASPAAFARRHPDLAATFKQPWPEPKPTTSVGIIRAVFPDWIEDYAIAIARCETGGTFDPRASGDGGNSIGLFQINHVWWHLPWVGGPDRLVDPWHNSRVALRISGGGRDWGPWTCARYV